MEKVTVSVYENYNAYSMSTDDDYNCTVDIGCTFEIPEEDVVDFLRMCKKNKKFVVILIDYTKGD